MPGSTGPDLNTFIIPEVELGDTFNYWRDTTNTAIYKLNKLRIYDAVDSASIGVTYGSTGAWEAFIKPIINTGHTFEGTVVLSGGVSADWLFVTKGTTLNSSLTVDGAARINGTTATSSTTTGALVVSGGVGVGGGLVLGSGITAGGGISAGGALTVGGAARIASTTASGSTGTGALVVGGGIGVGGALNVGGTFSVYNEKNLLFWDTDNSNYLGFKAPSVVGINRIWTLPSVDGSVGQALVTNGSGTLSWGVISGVTGSDRQVHYNQGGVFGATSGFIFEYNSANGHAPGTVILSGALIAGGGITAGGGISASGPLTVGGAVKINATTASTSTTTGALVVAGGVGVGGGISAGGALTVGGSLRVVSTTTFAGAPSYASDPGSANVLARKSYVDNLYRIGSTVCICSDGQISTTPFAPSVPSGWTVTPLSITLPPGAGRWVGAFFMRCAGGTFNHNPIDVSGGATVNTNLPTVQGWVYVLVRIS